MQRAFRSYPLRHLAMAALLPMLLAFTPLAGSSYGGANAVGGTASGQQSSTLQPTPTPSKPILLTDRVPDPKQPGVLYFSQTGHTLRGAFLDYWRRYGGLAQFGYPLTEEFFEPVGADNKLYRVQYFERNRFEHHPENAGTQYEVLLGALGREFHSQDPPAAPLPDARYFPETGHNLSGVFRQYWETHGGLFVHGYPITEQIQEVNPTDKKGYTVQYFERSRFEHHPQKAGTPYEVQLGLLGVQLSQKKGYPYGWYPSYGHAPDFSWISGELELHETYATANLFTGCDILRYEQHEKGASVQLDGQGWNPYKLPNLPDQPKVYIGDFLVVFGHRALPGERYWYCVVKPSPGYLVDKVQKNPAR